MIVKKMKFYFLLLLFFTSVVVKPMFTQKPVDLPTHIPMLSEATRQQLKEVPAVASQFHIYDKESDYNVMVSESVIDLVPVVKKLLQRENSNSIGLKDDYANGTVEALFNILILPQSDRKAQIEALPFAELLPVAAYAHSLQIAPEVGKIFAAEIKFKLADVYEGKMRLTEDDYAVLNNMVGDFTKTIVSDEEWLYLIENFTVAIMRKNYNKSNIRFKNIASFENKDALKAIRKIVFSPTNDRIVCMTQQGDRQTYVPCFVDWRTGQEHYFATKSKGLGIAFTADETKIVYRSEYEQRDILVYEDIIEGKTVTHLIDLYEITQGLYDSQEDVLTDRLAVNNDYQCAFYIISRNSNLKHFHSRIFFADIQQPQKPLKQIYKDWKVFIWWLRFNPKDGSLLYLKNIYSPYKIPGFDMSLYSISKNNNYLGESQKILDVTNVRDGASVALSKDGGMMAFIKGDESIEIRKLDKPNVLQKAWYHPNQSNISFEKPVTAIDFSRDGRLLIGGTWLGDIVVWSTATGKQLGLFKALSQNLSISASADGKKLVVGGVGYNEKVNVNLFMWDYMSDNDLSALEKMKDTTQITPAQMVLLKLIYGAFQNGGINEALLTEADQSVFALLPVEIKTMLYDKGFVRSKFEPIIEGPFKEEKASQMITEQAEKALQNTPKVVRKEVAKKGYLQKLIDLINYYKRYVVTH